MTIRTWLPLAYPVAAIDVPADEALPHSLRKWEHMLPDVLAQHGLRAIGRELVDADFGEFRIGGETCALCYHFAYPPGKPGCSDCPLTVARGGVPCDRERPDEELAPWFSWTRRHDPAPMIHWLRVAIEGGARAG